MRKGLSSLTRETLSPRAAALSFGCTDFAEGGSECCETKCLQAFLVNQAFMSNASDLHVDHRCGRVQGTVWQLSFSAHPVVAVVVVV